MFLAKYKWFRKWKGGTWHYNRYWFDAGTTCFFRCERHCYGNGGGQRYTCWTEVYKQMEVTDAKW